MEISQRDDMNGEADDDDDDDEMVATSMVNGKFSLLPAAAAGLG